MVVVRFTWCLLVGEKRERKRERKREKREKRERKKEETRGRVFVFFF